ncbi:type II toxin-antitoxin system RelE/ParE family toxin [Glaesserella parasuis]|uniref:selenocysteine synthase n=1 Tax=Glaesserella parasuis TaxID=738 RepID=UPI0003AC28FC|nr:selenocysteine synthase [Glaesserella parasuis]AIK17535.1 toxin [Glaesserella parasuis]EQA07178.1 selenocysteine synthase [Glaesserella parasuis 84-15995]KDB48535.1 hypothetical protein HPS11_06260 [Glaesserella parasuis HPS11]KDD78823.1 toxin [Glaesserella parasuis ST4-1]MCT8560072.1 type II toxin-antitoxin system RelE/ParE family toxin [Glaesserella parasuis]
MNVAFVELPPFEEYRKKYLDDDSFRLLQNELLKFPDKGELIQGTGGLRKLRIVDIIRQKGKRGGARVIYYYYVRGKQVWLFHAYNKNQQDDLSNEERVVLANTLSYLKSLVR